MKYSESEREELLKKIGDKIKFYRQQIGIGQAELARRCDRDKQAIERIENGKINTSVYMIWEIAKALEIPLRDLMDVE